MTLIMPYDFGTHLIYQERWPNHKTRCNKWSDGEEQYFNKNGQRHE